MWKEFNSPENYDYLFIVFPLYNILSNTPYYNAKDLTFYNEIISIINKNNFKHNHSIEIIQYSVQVIFY